MFDTIEEMKAFLNDRRCKPLSWYKPGRVIKVNDKMQKNYSYTLTEPVGKNFGPLFKPELTPIEMLRRGVFEGKYLNDCMKEFPHEWYSGALKKGKLSPEGPNPKLNEFKVKSRKSLQYWRAKGWTPINKHDKDVRAWFLWYCRFYIGRRQPEIDAIQIRRWRAFRRHAAQLRKNCRGKKRYDPTCRPRQRQALLQWAYDPYP